MTHEMKLQDTPFQSIKSGLKTIEMRLYDEKRKQIQVGDQIVFTNLKTGEKMLVKVDNLYLFDSFKSLYNSFNKQDLGYKKDEKAVYTDMEQYYSKQEQEKYGVVGIKISMLENTKSEQNYGKN